MKKKDLVEFFKWAREYEHINLVDLKTRKILIPETDLRDTFTDDFSSVRDYIDTMERDKDIKFINTTYGISAGGKPDVHMLEDNFRTAFCRSNEKGELEIIRPSPKEIRQGCLARCWRCGKYLIPDEEDIKEGKSLLEYLRQAYDKYGWRLTGDARFMCWVCDKDADDTDMKTKFSTDILVFYEKVSCGGY